jgi:hypothetical protein
MSQPSVALDRGDVVGVGGEPEREAAPPRRVSSRFSVVWEPTSTDSFLKSGRREVHGVDHAAQYAVALAHALAEAGSPARRLAVSIESELEGNAVQSIALHVQGEAPGLTEEEFKLFARLAVSGCRLWDALPASARVEVRTSLGSTPAAQTQTLAAAASTPVPTVAGPLPSVPRSPLRVTTGSRASAPASAEAGDRRPARRTPRGRGRALRWLVGLTCTVAVASVAMQPGALGELPAVPAAAVPVVQAAPTLVSNYATATAAVSPVVCQDGQPPRFVLGFAQLRAQVGNVMGTPVECEHLRPDGTTVQTTTTGLALYQPTSGRVSFTDG